MSYNPGTAGGGGAGQGLGGFGTSKQIYLDATFGRDTGKSLSSAFNPSNAFLTLAAAFAFIVDNALDATTVVVRNGQYAGATLTLPFDFVVGNAVVAEGNAAKITSKITLNGAGLFEMRGLQLDCTDEPCLDVSSAAFVVARLHGCPIVSNFTGVAVDANAIVVGDLSGVELLGGTGVQCNFLGASGTLTTTAAIAVVGAGSIVNVLGGRHSAFSQDAENHLAFIHHRGASANARVVIVNAQLDLSNTNAAAACEMSILRSVSSGSLEFLSSGGAVDYTVNNPSSESIIPIYLDAAGAVFAAIGSQLVAWNSTPDARIYAAAAAVAGNVAILLASSFVNLSADVTPGRYSTPGVLGSVVVGAHNNLGSLVASALGKGLRLTSPDGVTTELVGLANGGGALAFT